MWPIFVEFRSATSEIRWRKKEECEVTDWKAADTLPISISEQDSERLLSRIRDPEEIEFRDKCRR